MPPWLKACVLEMFRGCRESCIFMLVVCWRTWFNAHNVEHAASVYSQTADNSFMISVPLLQITNLFRKLFAVSLISPPCRISSLPRTFISKSEDYSIIKVGKQTWIPTEFNTNREREIRVLFLVINCCTYFLVCFNLGLKHLKTQLTVSHLNVGLC